MMLQIASGVAFFWVLLKWVYFLRVILPKQKEDARIRNGLSGTREELYRTGKLFAWGGPVFLAIFFQRMTGLYFIPPEYLSPFGTLLFAYVISEGVKLGEFIYPVKSFREWL